MTIPARGEDILANELGNQAVTDLVYKFDNDAIPAVFAFMADNPRLSLREAYDHTMEHYQGAWESVAEYIGQYYMGTIEEALENHTKQHGTKWPVNVEEIVSAIDLDQVAEFATGNTIIAIRSHFGEGDKQYFLFETGC